MGAARVLITGGTGFIGRRLVEACVAHGHDVSCLVRSTSRVAALQRLRARCYPVELSDPNGLVPYVQQADVVFHLAGATVVRRGQDFRRVNCDYTENVAQACAKAMSATLIHVSSLAVAGPSPPDARPRIEADPPRPVSQYGRSKWAGEQRVRAFAHALPISIVRPPIVFGPGDEHMLSMFKTVALKLHLVPGFRTARFSLIHVDDLVSGLLAVWQRGQRLSGTDDPSFRGTYFLADSALPTYRELGTLVARAMGHRTGPVSIPIATPVCYGLGAVAQVVSQCLSRPLFLSVDKMREATAGSWTCSPERAHHELGFQPASSLLDRLCSTAAWYRYAGWLPSGHRHSTIDPGLGSRSASR